MHGVCMPEQKLLLMEVLELCDFVCQVMMMSRRRLRLPVTQTLDGTPASQSGQPWITSSESTDLHPDQQCCILHT